DRLAPCGPHLPGGRGPGPAAANVDRAGAVLPVRRTLEAGRAVGRDAVVASMVAVGHPLERVAQHVVEAKVVRRERSDRRGRAPVPAAAAADAGRHPLPDFIAPVARGARAGTGRVLPLGLARQPVDVPGLLTEPPQVFL